jgi:hypothetical protein
MEFDDRFVAEVYEQLIAIVVAGWKIGATGAKRPFLSGFGFSAHRLSLNPAWIELSFSEEQSGEIVHVVVDPALHAARVLANEDVPGGGSPARDPAFHLAVLIMNAFDTRRPERTEIAI